MNILIGKKQIILASLVVALALAVFVNWYYTDSGVQLFPDKNSSQNSEKTNGNANNGEAEYVGNVSDNEYFASVRLSRNSAHDDALEELQAVLSSASENSQQLQDTAKAIEQISSYMQMETDIESLVNGKTGSECVAVISENTVEIIVNSNSLTDENVLHISDIVKQVCNNKFENIRISGKVFA